jgi:pimeloyl-ACP methyl ester carboxylesterase
MLPGEDAFRFFDRARRTFAGSWRNRVSIRLLSSLLELQGHAFLPVLGNRPTLFVQGTQDLLSPPATVLRLMATCGPGASWEWVPTHNHFDLYDDGSSAREAAQIVAAWLAREFAGLRVEAHGPPRPKGRQGPSGPQSSRLVVPSARRAHR